MKIIKDYVEHINDEIDGAKEYAGLARAIPPGVAILIGKDRKCGRHLDSY